MIKQHSALLELHNEQDDRCFVRLAAMNGAIKATPKKMHNYAFIVSESEEYYFKQEDLETGCDWQQVQRGKKVRFLPTTKQNGHSPTATAIKILA